MLNFKYIQAILFVILSTHGYINAKNDTILENKTTTFSEKRFPEDGFRMAMQDHGKALRYFYEKADYYNSVKDTSNYLHCMVGLAYIEQNRGNYNSAFDILWNSMQKIPSTGEMWSTIKLHQQLGILYGVYGKDSLSLKYLKQGLEIGKEFVRTTEKKSYGGSVGYFGLANQYVRMKNYNLALSYLDSSYMANNSDRRLHFTDAIYGHIYTQQGDYLKAEKYLQGIIPYFSKKPVGYLAMAYSYIAELKQATGEQDSALYYYEKSYQAIESLKVHPEIKPDILEKLALLYFAQHDKSKAFKYMQAAKFMSDSLFNTQSNHNKELFEIKNQYQEDLSKQKELIVTQNNLLEAKDKASFRLKLLIGILLILIIIAFVSFKLKSRMKKMVYEQGLAQEKNDSILEIKNKELTTNALQIIEKEHSLQEILDALKESDPEKYKELSRKYKQNNKKLWDDFSLRFAQINTKFYDRLLKLYPDLTPTDLKLCALIKLNFDSKEMSQILAISAHGVHTARSRVRKKLNLAREDSLSAYMAKV